jgi:Na+-driven multidrug efflux pump
MPFCNCYIYSKGEKPILRLFTLYYHRRILSTDFSSYSRRISKGYSFEAILTCLVFSYIGYFNGHGMSLAVMFQGITASFLIRVPLSYLFSLKEGASLFDIGLAVPAASVYGIIFFTVCYVRHLRKNGRCRA